MDVLSKLIVPIIKDWKRSDGKNEEALAEQISRFLNLYINKNKQEDKK